MEKQLLETVRSLAGRGETAEALASLKQLTGPETSDWNKLTALLQSRWAHLKNKELSGTIDPETADRLRNQINSSLLEIVAQLDSGKPALAPILQSLEGDPSKNSTQFSGTNVHIDRSSEVVIGSGNTITKKISHALGRRQFLLIALGLVLLGALLYFFSGQITDRQDASFASLSDIKQELARLANQDTQYANWSEEIRGEFEANLEAGMNALQKGDYSTAVQQLEQLSYQVPLATVFKNLSFSYEQMGDWENASKYRQKALEVDPGAYPEKSLAELQGKRINLLQPENGGKMLAGDAARMAQLNDGLVDLASYQYKSWAIFGFKDKRTALIDQVDFYVGRSLGQVEFELLAGNDSPTGPFTSIGTFKPFDGIMTESPFQPFPFPPVRAKYVKFQLIEGLHWHELRVWGKLE